MATLVERAANAEYCGVMISIEANLHLVFRDGSVRWSWQPVPDDVYGID